MKVKSLFIVISATLVIVGCKQEFPDIRVSIDDFEKDIIIYKDGNVLREINNKRTFPIELQHELNSMVSYDIDSLNRVLYINNYVKELLAVSLDNGQILYQSNLDEMNFDGEASHRKMRGKVFHIINYSNKLLLVTDWDVIVYDKKLELQKKLLDSVALINPRIPKGFVGDFDYSLKEDSIKLSYQIRSYRYGLDDLSKLPVIENYTFKL